MKYSAAQAGKAVGRSTATITRAIEKHKLSAVKDENGAWQIDPAELHRVFEMKKPENPTMQSDEKSRNAEGLQRDLDLLAEKLRSAEAMNDRLSDEVADLRARLDAEGEERRKLTAILTDQRNRSAALAPEIAALPPDVPARRGWWSSLWGRAANG